MAEFKEKSGAVAEGDASVQQTARTRSPAYPGIGLETAIKRAKELYAQEKMNPVPLTIAVKRWGFKEKSSGGLVAIAALKSFGLLKDSGSGKDRKLQLTDEARRIILDTRQESPERDQVIKEAALRPKIHNTLWKRWGTELPSDETVQHALIFEWSFNENIVRDFLKGYKDTILFAKLTDSDTMSVCNGDKIEIAVGDYVQWESGGAIQFEAKRITELSDDGTYAFVEGSKTGLPIDQLMKVKAPHGENPTSSNNPLAGLRPQTITPYPAALYAQGGRPVTIVSTNTFPIPLKQQNQATISFARMPLDKSDLELLKKWIVLMEDNLTEPLPNDPQSSS